MIKYEIEGGHLPVLICYPEMGETLVTEGGAMSWMSENMIMNTTSGGGIKKMFGRLFSGESMFLNEYTPEGGSGMIAFSPCFPGSIMPYHVTPGNGVILQKGSFLAMEKQLELSVFLQKKLRTGFFGGEGFILQKVSGEGIVFIEIDGHCKEYELKAGESIVVDTGYLAALTESCSMDIQTVKGAKNVFFGGEGLFNTKITGPGKVYLQSMPIMHMAEKISPYISSTSSVNVSSGSDSGSGSGE